eukprot:4115417-Karenia_brevis.AAC.1
MMVIREVKKQDDQLTDCFLDKCDLRYMPRLFEAILEAKKQMMINMMMMMIMTMTMVMIMMVTPEARKQDDQLMDCFLDKCDL